MLSFHTDSMPIKILKSGYINNIGAKDSAEDIIRDMKEFKQVLKEHSDKWKHNTPSYVSFSTIGYAPKFCSLTVPPSPPEPWVAAWVPPLGSPTGTRSSNKSMNGSLRAREPKA